MYPEFRNIAILVYLVIKFSLKGRLQEAKACFIGAQWRTVELFEEVYSTNKVTCDFCDWNGPRFKTFVASTTIRRNAVCPKCLSLERHREFIKIFRILKLYIKKRKIEILDIAPTLAFSNYCKGKSDFEYLSIDLKSQFAMKHMNLENLQIESNTFDVIVCYHVLDYLDNDVKGMNEIYRVLNQNGIALTQEGIDYTLQETIEWDKAVVEKEYRIRQYGKDFFNRWQSVGFTHYILKGKGLTTPVIVSMKSSKYAEIQLLRKHFENSGYITL